MDDTLQQQKRNLAERQQARYGTSNTRRGRHCAISCFVSSSSIAHISRFFFAGILIKPT
jgi:hypothetical protein